MLFFVRYNYIITGSYLADEYGNWVGSPDFQYSSAMYDFSLSNFQVNTYDQYIAMMTAYRTALNGRCYNLFAMKIYCLIDILNLIKTLESSLPSKLLRII